MNAESQYEDSVSSMMLENIKHRLLNAFRIPAAHVLNNGSSNPCNMMIVAKDSQAHEELRRAKIDGAITWLRTELMEMRSQDQQLAKTLLDLNREIQKLRRENDLTRASEFGQINVTIRKDSPFQAARPEDEVSIV
ncbi:alanine and arginine-rich domain-containing protein [Protopterus annectens]|uniref:alanine and arginine-rich domain-containing protein n=1 Tax=Protopterus annectens TaxID=7888 RepID=UPI001CF99706|nr:alanine and arginine-rich domain-containing protein [Protopterus annectens]